MKIKCPNRDTYQGDFKNGSPSGKFIFTNSKGEISEVDFKRLKNPSMSNEWTPSSSPPRTEGHSRPSDSTMVWKEWNTLFKCKKERSTVMEKRKGY